MAKKCSFNSMWIKDFSWVQEVPNDRYSAYCCLCNGKLNLSNMGRRAITSHQGTIGHKGKEGSASKSEEEIYQCSELQQVVNIFRDENACPGDIDDAGYKVLIALYGRKKSEETRDSRIFKLFQKSLVKNNFKSVFLPPTTAAAREHSLRAYHTNRFNFGVDLPKGP
ncbi:hypothetical protein AVEN_92815-1 [Araneus ventricosus]|uniref:Uncharacterized protein n=1 Tax=Araneus ventricosus TaxID=182803 RepID=A0A4Y2IXS0_ARAVE|nr:hypothetical protein AVEN_92815-1 [Araneus ventricosus]